MTVVASAEHIICIVPMDDRSCIADAARTSAKTGKTIEL